MFTALILLVTRMVFGGALMLLSRASTEASLLVIADVPTLAIYWLLQKFGMNSTIRDSFDAHFFVIGAITWAVLGYVLGYVIVLMFGRSGGEESKTSGNRPTTSATDE